MLLGRRQLTPYDGDNLLLRRGAIQVADNGRYLQHADGTPFKWLAEDRTAKGFNVIHFAAGFVAGFACVAGLGAGT